MNLSDEIQFLTGVGPKIAESLKTHVGIFTFKDLLYYFPYKHLDRSVIYKVNDIKQGMPYIQLKGFIKEYRLQQQKRGKRLTATFADNTGVIELTWFKGYKWIQDKFHIDKEIIIFGKPALYGNNWYIAHPEIEYVEDFNQKKTGNLQPVYSVPEKLKNKSINTRFFQKATSNLFQKKIEIRETLPAFYLKKYKLLNLKETLKNIHYPESIEKLNQARFRLKFEELFYIQLNILKQKLDSHRNIRGFIFKNVGDYLNEFYHKHIPFELTGAQKRVIKEIRKDMGSGKQMNRLLQGDVGSGKTLVALMCMLIALDNKFQACLMAPTEILATQHFHSIGKMLKGMDVEIGLLTGSTSKKERTILHEKLQSGDLQILIGTHALIEDSVEFKNLGLAVIDEQHRFGVAQRAKLWKKNTLPPHILVMTATPIPRTLAMTFYGDLDLSVIDELPKGRKPIKTYHYNDSKRLRLFGFIKQEIKKGNQIYVVYPLIDESEKMDLKYLKDGIESIARAFPEPDYSICAVHGKMKPDEKELAMQTFVKGKCHIMVATTVIEVGVDVPNANVMVIENAERFGLSQLHQLRGRVGRGSEQAYCILMTNFKISDDAQRRMQIMTGTNNGFVIAEEDLKLRGPGDLEGTQQSGVPFDLKMADLSTDGKLLQYVRDIANEILENDPELNKENNYLLQKQLKILFGKKINWRNIS